MSKENPGGAAIRRKPVPNRVRFEVFKRDKFACQYCGASAPDIVLECDHIEPVALGGPPDILNLITSCKTCNSGKGAIPLSDTTAIDKQRGLLVELEERRQQIEMMVEWRDELRGLDTETVEIIADRISDRGQYSLNESGMADVRRWLKNFSVGEILRAVDEAFDTYLIFVEDKVTSESWNIAFRRVPGIVRTQRQEGERPYLRRLFYIQGIIRKRTHRDRYQCVSYLEHIHLCGEPLDDMERHAKTIDDLSDFEIPYDSWLKSIGRPF